MQNYSDCFQKVKKKCFNFISAQETKKEKFKNKEKMIKSFLIPICFWINKNKPQNKTFIIGLAGGQGTGKTTISSLIRLILTNYFKLKVFKVSIDDFYKTRKERLKLSKSKHPLLLTRGVPGTHDIDMMNKLFHNIKKRKFNSMLIPKFDKSIDDRSNKKFWHKIKKKPDVLILEGWCVGAKPEKGNTLKVTTVNGVVCIISPVASVAQDPEAPDLNIPKPDEFVPDPVGTRAFVDASMREMTEGF